MTDGIGIYKNVWSLVSDGNYIFAGVDNGVYITTNNGVNWILSTTNNYPGNVLLINGNNIYAGTDHGVFRSTNNGQNWTQLGLTNRAVWALAVKDNFIFAGTVFGHGVYRSSDGGLTWEQTSISNTDISSFAIVGNSIFAGDWVSSSVFLSTNNGGNWTQISIGGTNTEVVLCLAVNGNDVFAGTDNGGVFRSTNGGLNWYRTSFNAGSVLSLKINSNNIFAGVGFSPWGVYLSTNNGVNWIYKKQGLNNVIVWSLTTTSQYIFAGTDSGVYRRDLSEIIGVKKIAVNVPSVFSLEQNYPNPFNSMTNVKFKMLNAGNAVIKVFDISGKDVATLVNEKLQPGVYSVRFDAGNLTSGIYFYRLQTENFTATKSMILLK